MMERDMVAFIKAVSGKPVQKWQVDFLIKHLGVNAEAKAHD